MPASSEIWECQMKPGDRVIWLRSPGRSFLTGWKVQRVAGVVVRVCRRRIRIMVRIDGKSQVVNVYLENVICVDEAGDLDETASDSH